MTSTPTKNICFAAGLLLVLSGAHDLYAGLVVAGLDEALLAEVSRSFMMLFPGYAFLAYSLYPSVTLTSHGMLRRQAELDTKAENEFRQDDLPENVIVFPGEPFERGPGRSGFRRYR